MANRRKVLVIGVDGATFDIITPLVKSGDLPNFAKLMARGSYGELKSTMPILSPVAWTTFSTGVRPGKHGIFNFLVRRDMTYEVIPASSAQRRVKPVWKVAGEHDRKVIVMNVPATFPPDEVNGLMIAGDPTPFHDERRVFPAAAYGDFEKSFGPGFLKPAPPFRGEAGFLNNLLKSVDLWTNLVKQRMQQQDWDLSVVVYTATDTAQHFFWKNIDQAHPLYREKTAEQFGDAIRAVYKKIDGALGELSALAGDDASVVVLSDHGFGPLYQAVPLTKWLIAKGYMTLKEGGTRKKRGVLLRTIRYLMGRLRLTEGLPPLSVLADVDWEKTKAYFLGVSGDIYINLQGREPRGIVAPGSEYEELVDRMSRELLALTLDDGSKPIAAVYKGKEVYSDSTGAPDLFVLWEKGFDLLKEGEPDNLFQRLRARSGNKWSGTHLEKGILLLSGASIVHSVLPNAAIEDVAPTIYHLLGMPVPRSVDGAVLTQAFDDTASQAVTYSDTDITEPGVSGSDFSDDDTRKVAESLKNLGYIE
jgi:predicted AlkP superfamily phosphohydrolase/phosphomutase